MSEPTAMTTCICRPFFSGHVVGHPDCPRGRAEAEATSGGVATEGPVEGKCPLCPYETTVEAKFVTHMADQHGATETLRLGGVATEGLRKAIDDIDAAIGSDPNYGDGPRLHRKAALALSLLESALSTTPPAPEGETEPCPTCMQPVPVPQLGDHDYGLPLVAEPSGVSLDAKVLGMAMDMVTEVDYEIGVVHRGSYAERVVAQYRKLAATAESMNDDTWSDRAYWMGRQDVIAEMEREGVVTWGDEGHRQRFLSSRPSGVSLDGLRHLEDEVRRIVGNGEPWARYYAFDVLTAALARLAQTQEGSE